jgi:hypothetical protein
MGYDIIDIWLAQVIRRINGEASFSLIKENSQYLKKYSQFCCSRDALPAAQQAFTVIENRKFILNHSR